MTARARSRAAPPVTVAGVALTNPGRILYPDQGLTKLDLARYYEAVAPAMLPHVADRPLTLVRCPRGQGQPCFFQKHKNESVPGALRGLPLTEGEGKRAVYLVVDDAAGLVALVQMGVLEVHVWGSRARNLERPDQVVLDVDPDPGLPWSRVTEAALAIRDVLAPLGLESWAKTTGGKGLHVVVPLAGRQDWDVVKAFSRAVAEAVRAKAPGRYLVTASKAARRGKIYLDWLRNGRGATAVAPWSTRARPGAPVAVPLSWSEVETATEAPVFDPVSALRRLRTQRADPWRGFFDARQSIKLPGQAAKRGSKPRIPTQRSQRPRSRQA